MTHTGIYIKSTEKTELDANYPDWAQFEIEHAVAESPVDILIMEATIGDRSLTQAECDDFCSLAPIWTSGLAHDWIGE